MIGFVGEKIHYESRVTACRVCPEHQAILDDELRCPQGHESDYWEVRYVRDGRLLEVLCRASEYDGTNERRKPLQPIPHDKLLSHLKKRYLVETAWRLRKRDGLTPAEARDEALRRWGLRVLIC